jgi:hypothetical protein
MAGSLPYGGPVIDTFLHGPWIGEAGSVVRADVVPWTDDARLRRVMSTFHHPDQPGGLPPQRSLDQVLAEMDRAGVARGILAAKVYYPTTPPALDA